MNITLEELIKNNSYENKFIAIAYSILANNKKQRR